VADVLPEGVSVGFLLRLPIPARTDLALTELDLRALGVQP
jgi:hypothetical protein